MPVDVDMIVGMQPWIQTGYTLQNSTEMEPMANDMDMKPMNKFNMDGEYLFASWTPNSDSEFTIMLLITFAFCFLIEFMMHLKHQLKDN